ncbi:MAG: 4'-phosphopantetheinyl transferase superfamily protein [Balneolaceae bacterium]
MIKRITHNDLQEEIILSFEYLSAEGNSIDLDEEEAISGAIILRRMAKKFLGIKELDIYTPKNEKPKAFIGDNELSVSFSHTKKAICAAISYEFNVGCDIESIDRSVNPAIISRIKCKNEIDQLYNETEPIRIWTCKEAALKMIGMGLRISMNSVYLKKISEDLFEVEFNNGKRAKICSFQHRDHWISVCYQ